MNRTSEFDLPLALLHEEIARSDLLPESYARYRPVLADGLLFFLRRLSSARLRRIFDEQVNLPHSVSTAERLVALLGHSPALHKIGQVIARDRRLSKTFRHQLQRLESLAPQTSPDTVMQLLGHECKNWRKAGIALESRPLAEGSVAVIMPFSFFENRRTSRQGVFKLLKPGIQQRLEQDLEILSSLGSFLDDRCELFHLPALDYQETFETIRTLLLHEVQFEDEQANLAEAAALYSRTSSVVIPALLPFCSARMTAMERLHGRPIPIGGGLRPDEFPEARARVIAEALVAEPIFSSRLNSLFHADPHAGNLLLMPDHRLGILDWSLVGRLPRDERVALAQLLVAALTLDLDRMESLVEQLSRKKPQQPDLSDILRSRLRQLRYGTFTGITWLTGLLDELVLRAGVRLSESLLFFRKLLLTLEGVMADLSVTSGHSSWNVLDTVLVNSFLNHWTAEWPTRAMVPWNAKSPTTHLSMNDLLSLVWSSGATISRWWNQTGLDLFSSSRPAVSAKPSI